MAKHLQESNLNNKSYDILKWVALVALPAASALYLTLAGLWHLPYPTEIAGTLAEDQGIHATFDQGVGDMLRTGKVTMNVKQV